MRLTLANVDVTYGGVIQVLRSTNITVGEGQMVVLLGANGAGKSTTLKAISGLLASDQGAVTAGRITFDGQDITNADPTAIFGRGLVQVLEQMQSRLDWALGGGGPRMIARHHERGKILVRDRIDLLI